MSESSETGQTHPLHMEISNVLNSISKITLKFECKKERRELLYLCKKLCNLRQLVESLNRIKKYLSRTDKVLLIRALKFYGHRQSVSLIILESALRTSTKEFIDLEVRKSISVILNDMLTTYGSELQNTVPETDDEIFEFITDEYEVTRKTSEELRKMGACIYHVLPTARKIVISGTESKEAFFTNVMTQWHFKDPFKYFEYTGEIPIPVGWLE